MASTNDPELFEEASRRLGGSSDHIGTLALSLSRRTGGELAKARQSSLRAALDQAKTVLDDERREQLFSKLFDAALDEEIPDERNIDELIERLNRSEPSLHHLAAEALESSSDLLDASRVLSAAKTQKTLNPFEVALFDRRELERCDKSLARLLVCGEKLREAYPELARVSLKQSFLHRLEEKILKRIPNQSAHQLADAFRDRGLDTANLARHACLAASQRAELGDTEAAEKLLRSAELFKPDDDCRDGVEAQLASIRFQRTTWSILRWIFVLPPIALFVFVARRKWRGVKEMLSSSSEPPEGKSSERELKGAIDHLIGGTLSSALLGALLRAKQALDDISSESEEPTGDQSAASKAISRVTDEAPDVIEALLEKTAKDALESGKVRSQLVDLEDLLLYLVVFPARHEHPHLLRRYPSFEGGWIEHIDALRGSLSLDEALGDTPMLELLLFLRPAANDGVLVVGYSDPDHQLAPATLLDEAEKKQVKGTLHSNDHELKLGSDRSEEES